MTTPSHIKTSIVSPPVTYRSGGSTTFAIPFGFLRSSDLKVYVNGTHVTEWDLSADRKSIVLRNTVDAAAGKEVTIKRRTGTSERYVTFTDGAMFTASQMNRAFAQLLYILQESINLFDPSTLTNSMQNLMNALDEVVTEKNGEFSVTFPTIAKSNLSPELLRIVTIVQNQISGGMLLLRDATPPTGTDTYFKLTSDGTKWNALQKPVTSLPDIVDTGEAQDNYAATVKYVKDSLANVPDAPKSTDTHKLYATTAGGTAEWRSVSDAVSLKSLKERVNSAVATTLGAAVSNIDLYARIAPIDAATGSMKIPAGTTAQRTTAATTDATALTARRVAKASLAGRIRCNSENHLLEYYDGVTVSPATEPEWYQVTSLKALEDAARILGAPGSTVNRPAAPKDYALRMNTDYKQLEFYADNQWRGVGGTSSSDAHAIGIMQMPVPKSTSAAEFKNIPASAKIIYITIQALSVPSSHALEMHLSSAGSSSGHRAITGFLVDGHTNEAFPWKSGVVAATTISGLGEALIAYDSINRPGAVYYGQVTLLRTSEFAWHVSSKMLMQPSVTAGVKKMTSTQRSESYGQITLSARLKDLKIQGRTQSNTAEGSTYTQAQTPMEGGEITLRYL